MATGLKEGKTKIILRDRNDYTNDSEIPVLSAVINVVKPAYLTIKVMPYKNWDILLTEQHEIVVEVFSR